jgi:hypothetical protein
MTMNETGLRGRRGGAVLALALFAACVSPGTYQATVATPVPCADSSYVQLRQQHPDSLSPREWQRLQTLDRECAVARAQAPRQASGMMGVSHGGLMGAGVAAVVMAAMIIAMW